MRILIAEDDPTSRLLLKTVLVRKGYEVIAATNGGEAWRMLQQEDAPKIAVLDWMMPEMDGQEICVKLRARESSVSTYVILLTAKSAKDEIVAGLQAGANDYITKPFVREELLARVQVGVQMVTLQQALSARVIELEAALAKVKQLEGMLPICASCKSIRDDSGYWNTIEDYVSEHSDAVFSHGICPDCAKRLYPEEFDRIASRDSIITHTHDNSN
ncbi:MAG TPA: response regulator transcription factor [Blastocatellia bacterium]|nr:response regulator transcription factor [Blastocatellia bacterium]